MQFRSLRLGVRSSLLAVLLLGGVTVAGISAWVAIESASDRVNAAVQLSVQLQEALDAARGAQVHFKMQVQEWKDILLRGRDGAAYQRHVENFERESFKTENRLLELRVVLDHLGLHSALATEALDAHARVMERYRAALAAFDRGGRADSRAADSMVTAIDREPMRQIGVIGDYVRGESARLLDSHRQAAFDRTHLAKQVLIAVICGALLAGLLLVLAHSRDRLHLRSLGAAATAGSLAVAAALLLAVLALAVLVGRTTGQALAAAERVTHPHEVRAQLEQLRAEINSADEAARDYATEQNPEMEREFRAAAQAVQSRIADLRTFPDLGMEPGELEKLDGVARAALAYDDDLMRARRESGVAGARAFMAGAGAGALRDAVAEIEQLLSRQRALVKLREASLDGEVSLLHWSLAAAAALVLMMLAAVVLLLFRDQRLRRAAQAQLESENRRLDDAVRERTASLARAHAELERLTRRSLQRQENERSELSTELENEISQQVAALLMNLQRIVRTMPQTASPALLAELQENINVAKSTYREVCELASDLRPAILDQLGLVAALNWFAREMQAKSHVPIRVVAPALAEEPGPEIATAIFRIAEEAVRNALRHAGAGAIVIALEAHPAALALHVSDDGAGFDTDGRPVDEATPGGLGLLVMRQRARSLGATLLVRSAPGKGTTVTVEVALAKTPARDAGTLAGSVEG